MRPVIIVFAKAPTPGRVKTRLIPPLDAEGAAALHSAFVLDTIESLQSLTPIADLELHTDTETAAWEGVPVPRRVQHEGYLGLKMLKALGAALERGHPRAFIFGSDSPNLPIGHVRALLDLDADLVFGPADDGGYYAIGARRVRPEIFAGVRWSTPYALGDTIRSAEACGLTTVNGPGWFDIDDASGLDRLRTAGSIPHHTAEALKTWMAEARETGRKRA
jgi:rSAM/selenodomain-associated transferase 1